MEVTKQTSNNQKNVQNSSNQSSTENAITSAVNSDKEFSGTNTGAHSFGAALRLAREQKNCTLDKVAGDLYILKRHLQALEAEDFKALPQMTFARGFAMNYAKYLGLDPNVIVKSFDEAYPENLKSSGGNIKTPLKPMGTLQRDAHRPSFRINPFLILGVIALIALAVFLLRTVDNARQETTATAQDEVVLNDISSSEQAQGAAITNTTNQEASLNNTAQIVATGSALDIGNEGLATTDATSSDGAAATQEDANLDFWVRDDTDITVTDAKGVVLMSGNQPRGGYKMTGQPPFQVQINKVRNVTLNLNQEKVPLADYAHDNQANFSLAP